MSEQRKYVCPGCGGIVRVPPRSRIVTLDTVRVSHERVCPALTRKASS